jgi:Rieske Fe-S protein
LAEDADKHDAGEQRPAEGEQPNGALPEAKPAAYFEGESMTRRRAFSVAAQGVGGVAGAAIMLPALGFALAPVFDEQDENWVGVGRLGDFTPDTYKSRVITIVPEIGEAGKTTVYVRRGNPDLNTQNEQQLSNDPDSELRESADEVIAISTRCVHLGCPVRYVNAAENFICPCHGGVYDFQGAVTGGPPVRPLDRFQTRVVAGQVEIGPRFSLTNSFNPVRARDPGEFTGGIWNVLYPPRPSTPPAP